MPPEQAAGDWDIVDERADVFALGALLCEMLTGQPPYHRAHRDDLLRRARRGDLAEALGRLEECGADAVLVDLCRDCLAAERLQRPRHAGAVAERLAAYQAEVQERLRRAELERTRAEVKALEERKRRRLLAVVALLILLIYAGPFCFPATSEAVALLKARPPAVVTEVNAALDEWTSERRRQGKAKEEWQRLLDLAALLDDDPGSKPRELRQIMARSRLPLERALDALSAALRPVPVPVEIPLGPDRGRLRQLAEETDAAREPILGLLTLVQALRTAGEEERAEQMLRAAIVAKPHEVVLHHTLSQLLVSQQPQRWAEAVECYGAARALRPDLGVNLATALRNSGRVLEGLALLTGLVRESPENPYLLLEQSSALLHAQKFAEAEAAVRKALALKPDELSWMYLNLGELLTRQGKHVEAEAAYRRLIEFNPELYVAYFKLGSALADQAKYVEAEAAFRKAITIWPDFAKEHRSTITKEVLGAKMIIAIFLPDYGEAFTNLGGALDSQGKFEESESVCRKAIAINPDSAEAYINLGTALDGLGKHVEAEATFRKAIVLKPNSAIAHHNLGHSLRGQGRFAESLAAFQHSQELGWRQNDSSTPSLNWIRIAEMLVELEEKLPAVVQGKESPANADDAIILAWMCQLPSQKRYAASARLYADAFAADPDRAANVNQRHRYRGAWNAALAAAGQGNDSHSLPNKVKAMFRRWALCWLRDDLTAYAKLAEQNNPDENKTIQQTMTHWRSDPDLASVRDPQALERLPENERADWQELWRDVDQLAKRAAK